MTICLEAEADTIVFLLVYYILLLFILPFVLGNKQNLKITVLKSSAITLSLNEHKLNQTHL